MREVEFMKIKLNRDFSVCLEYRLPKMEEKYDNYKLNCTDRPLQSFNDAMLNLRKHFLQICELSTSDSYINKATVRGVSFKYCGEKHIMGATLSGTLRLNNSNSPLIINTPFKTIKPINDLAEPTGIFTDECGVALEQLLDEAQKYLDGEREQPDLFDEEDELDDQLTIPENNQES